jgi:RND family efflux transporter MFP subunit
VKKIYWQVLVVAILAAAIAGAGFFYWQKAKNPAVIGKTVTIKRGMVRSMVQATGLVAAVHSVDISSKITGRIVEVRAGENDVVTAGQVLIVLDDSHYKALMEQAAAQLEVCRKNYERMQKLTSVGGAPQKELDGARMEWQVAEADYIIALSQVNDAVIRASISGTVVGKPVPAGQTVSPGLSSPLVLMTIADVSRLELQVQVDEADIGKIKAGQKVGFMVDAVPNKMFVGKIAILSEKANIQQNVVYYPVTIALESANTTFKPGMTVRVTVVTGQKKDVLTVPAVAIAARPDGSYVKVVKNGQVREVMITKGLIGTDRLEVTSGLQEGDQVLLPSGAAGGMMGMPRLGVPGGGHH